MRHSAAISAPGERTALAVVRRGPATPARAWCAAARTSLIALAEDADAGSAGRRSLAIRGGGDDNRM